MVKEIESFEEFQALIQCGKVIIFYFWATWCGPCKLLTPLFEKFAKETTSSTSQIEFYRVNIDEYGDVGKAAQVKSMPTIVMYKDAERLDGFIGAIPRKLDALITKAISLTKLQQPENQQPEPRLPEAQQLEAQLPQTQQVEVQHEVEAQQPEPQVQQSEPEVKKSDADVEEPETGTQQPGSQHLEDRHPDTQQPDAPQSNTQQLEAEKPIPLPETE